MVNMIKVVIAITILLMLLAYIFLRKRIKHLTTFNSAQTIRAESKWIESIVGWLVLIIAIAYYIRNKPEASIVMWFGVAVYFLGGVLQIASRKQLEEALNLEEKFGKQKGIYKHIRHPSKTACLLMLTGICIALGSGWALLLMVVLFVPAILFRISQEEKALADKHGEDWLIYQSDTKKLVPGMV